MMMQSVNTQAANLFGSQAGSAASKGKQIVFGFETILTDKLNTGSSDTAEYAKAARADERQKNAASAGKTGKKKHSDDHAAASAVRTDMDDGTDAAVNSGKDVMNSNGVKSKNADAAEDSETPEQLAARLAMLMENVRAAVMEALKLTSEELDRLLAEQGLQLTDLLQPGKLQQLILASQGESDITAALTDESLAAAMKELLQNVEDIKGDFQAMTGDPLTDGQMKEILDRLYAAQEASENPTSVQFLGQGPSPDETAKEAGDHELKTGQNDQQTGETGTEDAAGTRDEGIIRPLTTDEAKGDQAGGQDPGKSRQSETKLADAFQTFVDNLVKSTGEVQTESPERLTELRDIANQIIERIRVSVTSDHSSMELQLNPEHLGKVQLSVQSRNGIMTAQFIVQNEVSREAIESQLHILRETLNSQGIKVEAIEVTVAAYASQDDSQKGSQSETNDRKNDSGRKITMEEAVTMTDGLTDESLVQMMAAANADSLAVTEEDLGSQIDYTA